MSQGKILGRRLSRSTLWRRNYPLIGSNIGTVWSGLFVFGKRLLAKNHHGHRKPSLRNFDLCLSRSPASPFLVASPRSSALLPQKSNLGWQRYAANLPVHAARDVIFWERGSLCTCYEQRFTDIGTLAQSPALALGFATCRHPHDHPQSQRSSIFRSILKAWSTRISLQKGWGCRPQKVTAGHNLNLVNLSEMTSVIRSCASWAGARIRVSG